MRTACGQQCCDKYFGQGNKVTGRGKNRITCWSVNLAYSYLFRAQYCGTPVIAPNFEGFTETVPQHAGVLCDRLEHFAALAQIRRVTGLPRLCADHWAKTLDTLASYADSHEFNLTECTAWTRDRLNEDGISVGRKAIGCIVNGALHGGMRLNDESSLSADNIREALIKNTIDLAGAANLVLTVEDEEELRDWLSGNHASEKIAG